MTRARHFANHRGMANLRLRFTLATIKLLALLLIVLIAPVVSAASNTDTREPHRMDSA